MHPQFPCHSGQSQRSALSFYNFLARLGSGHQLGTHTNVNFGTRYMQKITFGGTQKYQNQNTKEAKIILCRFVCRKAVFCRNVFHFLMYRLKYALAGWLAQVSVYKKIDNDN